MWDGVGNVECYTKMAITLEEVKKMYNKWLYFEQDTQDRIDIILAVALAAKKKGIPLWLFLVGSSGDMKSEQIRALDDEFQTTYRLPELTSKTLVSGNPKVLFDIVEQLRNKLVLTYDMSAMLEMHYEEKAALWSKLRDLYDGFAGKDYGTGISKRFTDVYLCWIAGSTPVIDNQILIHQSLGTRELIYRLPDISDKLALRKKILENEPHLEKMRAELKLTTQAFLSQIEERDIKITEEVFNELGRLAEYVTYMRAMAETDRISRELIRDVTPELPTRIFQQFIRLYRCLKSLDAEYKDEDALRIIGRVAKSSIHPIRVRLLEDVFLKHPHQEFTMSSASKILKTGKGAAYQDLNILWNLGLVERREQEILYGGNPSEKFIYYFFLNLQHPFIRSLLPQQDTQLTFKEAITPEPKGEIKVIKISENE